jgi:cell wall-associated NlpC family hydrolase
MKNIRVSLRLLKYMALIFIVVQLSGCATSEKSPISASSSSIDSANSKAVNDALQLQGQPYVSGGESPIEGFDCSGLVFYVYNKQGVRLPRDTWSLANQLPSVQINQRQPGDLVFFNTTARPFSHVGIYVGDDRFVHAPSSRTGRVMMSDLKQPYWRERFVAVRRPQSQRPLSVNNAGNNACLLN